LAAGLQANWQQRVGQGARRPWSDIHLVCAVAANEIRPTPGRETTALRCRRATSGWHCHRYGRAKRSQQL